MENTYAPDDEISLLDLLVTITENIKLLVIGPAVAGLLTLVLSIVWPNTFESKAVLNANQGGVDPNVLLSMATTDEVLQRVRQQADVRPDLPPASALKALRDSIKVSVGRVDKLVTITVTATSAEQAQRINQALLAELFKQSRPRGEDLARLNTRLQFQQEALDKAVKLEQEFLSLIQSDKVSDRLMAAYVDLSGMKGAYFDSIQSLEAQIKGIGEAALVQTPTLPPEPSSNKKALLTIVAALATGFALLLFVFVRQAFVNAAANPESAAKLARIKNSFRTRLNH